MRTLLALVFVLCLSALSVQAADKISLRMGIDAGLASIEYAACMEFIKGVQERTGGQVEIQMFEGSQLGDDRALLEQIAAGVLDLGQGDIGRFQLWIPYADIFGLPYVFDDYTHVHRTFKSAAGENYKQEMLDMGWRALSIAYNGTRQTSSSRAINSIDDMKGLKLRVPNAASNMNFAKFTGASPTPMAFNEVYMALKTGAVDAQENPLPAVLAMKFYEVQKYIAMTNHIINNKFFVVSEIVWKGLPENVRKAIQESADAAAEFQTKMFVNQEAELIETFKKEGLEICTPDLAAFQVACKPIVDEYAAKYGDTMLKAVQETK